MAEEGGEGEDRTEAPSDKRLQQARDGGQVPLSREASLLAVLAAGTLVLAAKAPDDARQAASQLAILFEQAHALDPAAAVVAAVRVTVSVVAPFSLVALLVGSIAVLVQTGFLFNGSAFIPNFGRLNPVHGLKRVFGVASLVEAGKSSIKVGAAGWAAWSSLAEEVPRLQAATSWDPAMLADRTMRVLLHVVLALLITQTVIAVLDVLRVRGKHMSGLRMSREEAKQEHKESEGDPHVKGRIKKMRMARSKRRMLAAVPEATVIVTNPTHYAVALAYVRGGNGAPTVVAKGIDDMAAKIRAIAAEHRVPIVPNPPLARALYTVELDREIPAEHFKTVAELIAYVWRLRGAR